MIERRQLCKGRLKESGFFFLWRKRRLRRNPIKVLQYLKGRYKEDGVSFFTRTHMEKTRGKRYKSYQQKFHLGIRKKFLKVRIISHWDNLPRDMEDGSRLEVFKI